jgi:hypothetical protein
MEFWQRQKERRSLLSFEIPCLGISYHGGPNNPRKDIKDQVGGAFRKAELEVGGKTF